MKTAIVLAGVAGAVAVANADTIGFVDFDGTETGLIAYTNSAVTVVDPLGSLGTSAAVTSTEGVTTWGPGDSFWSMSRAVVGPNGFGIPFSISDDSVSGAAGNGVSAGDEQGFAGNTVTSGFFGVSDTVNSANPGGGATATFVFDITDFFGITVSIDMAAMGNFEFGDDDYAFEYSIDGSDFETLFRTEVLEDSDRTYEMDGGATPTIIDPVNLTTGEELNDVFQTVTGAIDGKGSTLTIRFSAQSNGPDEAFGFDNLLVEGNIPAPGAAAVLGVAGLAATRRRRA